MSKESEPSEKKKITFFFVKTEEAKAILMVLCVSTYYTSQHAQVEMNKSAGIRPMTTMA